MDREQVRRHERGERGRYGKGEGYCYGSSAQVSVALQLSLFNIACFPAPITCRAIILLHWVPVATTTQRPDVLGMAI